MHNLLKTPVVEIQYKDQHEMLELTPELLGAVIIF